MEITDDKLVLRIPITGATSKIRIKRRQNNFGNPISTKANPFTKDDYLEWQISYFAGLEAVWKSFKQVKDLSKRLTVIDNMFSLYKNQELVNDLKDFFKNNPKISKRKEFKENIKKIFLKHGQTIIIKPQKDIYILNELFDLIKVAFANNLISKEEIEGLISFNEKEKVDIEAQYKIKRIGTGKKIIDNFECFDEESPLFINNINDNSFVEIILQHRQKAVGYQSMVYFGVYIKNVVDENGASLIGRKAREKEIIKLEISKEHLINIAKAFITASADHSKDMKGVLQRIIK